MRFAAEPLIDTCITSAEGGSLMKKTIGVVVFLIGVAVLGSRKSILAAWSGRSRMPAAPYCPASLSQRPTRTPALPLRQKPRRTAIM